MHMRLIDKHLQKLSTGVGCVSLGMGLLLTLAPRSAAALLGWGNREPLARAIGAADLIVGPGLLLDSTRRARWMHARALLSAAIALIYIWILSDPSWRSRRAIGMLGLMAAVTATDYSLYRRLEEGTPGNQNRSTPDGRDLREGRLRDVFRMAFSYTRRSFVGNILGGC